MNLNDKRRLGEPSARNVDLTNIVRGVGTAHSVEEKKNIIAMHGMSFHFGFGEVILFDGWKTSDLNGVAGSMVGIILLGMIYEALKNYREYLNVSNAVYNEKDRLSRKEAILSPVHVLQTALHGLQLVISYFLMFIFMTYNVYLCIAVVIGATLGYFLFAWKNTRCDIAECCM